MLQTTFVFLIATSATAYSVNESKMVNDNSNDYPCDGGTCSGDGTCCSGKAAPCCPYTNGQCCASTDTCCPSGTDCYYDPSSGTDSCKSGKNLLDGSFLHAMATTAKKFESTKKSAVVSKTMNTATPTKSVVEAKIVKDNSNDYPCDGGTCSGDGTCCSGKAAPCCPYINGQCCASTDTCCPSGTDCYYDPSSGTDSCKSGKTPLDGAFLYAMATTTTKA